jgi:hypothetical protein
VFLLSFSLITSILFLFSLVSFLILLFFSFINKLKHYSIKEKNNSEKWVLNCTALKQTLLSGTLVREMQLVMR